MLTELVQGDRETGRGAEGSEGHRGPHWGWDWGLGWGVQEWKVRA